MRGGCSRRGGPLIDVCEPVGGRTNDPGGNSLRLLPSGPDRVGEVPVRRRPPGSEYHASGEWEQGDWLDGRRWRLSVASAYTEQCPGGGTFVDLLVSCHGSPE